MSSSLLSKRLRQLEQAGIVERRRRPDGKGNEYHLTPAGEELGPVVAQMGIWSERWLRRPIFEETPDTGVLMWWMRGTVKTDALPAGRDPFPLPRGPREAALLLARTTRGGFVPERSRVRRRHHRSQRPEDADRRVDGRRRPGRGAQQARHRTRRPRASRALLPEVVRTAPVRQRRAAPQSAATRPRLASEPSSRVALSQLREGDTQPETSPRRSTRHAEAARSGPGSLLLCVAERNSRRARWSLLHWTKSRAQHGPLLTAQSDSGYPQRPSRCSREIVERRFGFENRPANSIPRLVACLLRFARHGSEGLIPRCAS
jgi:hypothetical protein